MVEPLPKQPSSKDVKKNVTDKNKGDTAYVDTALTGSNPSASVKKEEPEYIQPGWFREGNKVIQESSKTGEKSWAFVPPEQHYQDREWYKKDNICTIRVLKGIEGQGQSNLVPPLLKFFLTGVDAPRSEKYQIVDTFGDWYIFFYGEQPSIYTFSGAVLNMLDHPWFNEFDYYYDSFLRGTMATRNVTRVFLTYGFQQVQGHILNFSHRVSAENDKIIFFTMQMAVVKRYALSIDDGNRLTDSFLLNTATIDAFKKLVKDENGSKFNYSMLKKILENKAEPSGPDVSRTKKERQQLADTISKGGLKTYPPVEEPANA